MRSAHIIALSAFLFSVMQGLTFAHPEDPQGKEIVIVYGKESQQNLEESRFALALARHAERWLKNGGLAADVTDDANLGKKLEKRDVAILIHCATLDDTQLGAIKKYISRGGKLIVTFSTSEKLAEIFGVAQGQYIRNRGGLFYSISFVQDRPRNIPATVRQSSANIISAYPIPGKSKAIAWWHDIEDKNTGFPAWLSGEYGFWMTHVLLADGDSSAKGKTLVAMVCALSPRLWGKAARARMTCVRGFGPWESAAKAVELLKKNSPSAYGSNAVTKLRRAEEIWNNARRMLDDDRAAEAWMLTEEYERLMAEAYGAIQTPQEGEIRAVWEHSGQGLKPGDWNATMRLLAQSGFSDIFVNVAGPGFAHCDIKSLPHSPVFYEHGDQLKASVEAGKKYGIRVHAWLICFSTTQATKERIETYKKQGWLLAKTGGGYSNWLDPSSKDARAMLTAAAEELLTKYDVAGLHLDFVRYPDYYGSLGYETRKRFERAHGKPVSDWPEAVKGGAMFKELTAWRANEVTALVADIRNVQRTKAPSKLVTAATLGKYPTCIESTGQDWFSWLDCGYIDYAVPMNYTENMSFFDELLQSQLASPKYAMRIIGGIGVTAAESRLSVAQVIDQIKNLRKKNAAGFALFDLDATLERETLPVLSLGICAPPGR